MNLPARIKERLRFDEVLDHLGMPHGRGRAPCPIHGGTNPSSFAYRDRYARCFSCGWQGDIFAFFEQVRGCDFKMALKELGALAGLDVNDDVDRNDLVHRNELRIRPESVEQEAEEFLAWRDGLITTVLKWRRTLSQLETTSTNLYLTGNAICKEAAWAISRLRFDEKFGADVTDRAIYVLDNSPLDELYELFRSLSR